MLQIEEIHNSLINGQRKQMVNQIDAYGNYDFWHDYKHFLIEMYPNGAAKATAFDYYTDATISYNRIKNR